MASPRQGARESPGRINPLNLCKLAVFGTLATAAPLSPSRSQPTSPTVAVSPTRLAGHVILPQKTPHAPAHVQTSSPNTRHIEYLGLQPKYPHMSDTDIYQAASKLFQFVSQHAAHKDQNLKRQTYPGQPGYTGPDNTPSQVPMNNSDGFGNCEVPGTSFTENSPFSYCVPKDPKCDVVICNTIVGLLASYLSLATIGSGPVLVHFGYIYMKRRRDPNLERIDHKGRHVLACIVVGAPTGWLTTIPASAYMGVYYVYKAGKKCFVERAPEAEQEGIELEPQREHPPGVDDEHIVESLREHLEGSGHQHHTHLPADTGAYASGANGHGAHGSNEGGPSRAGGSHDV